MQMIMAVALLVVGLVGPAEAGRGRRGGGGSSRIRSAPSGTGSSSRSTAVRGYAKKNGTYVAPARRSASDGTQRNNFGTKGNTNPYTGKAGTRNALR